jgi:hypothetical protein
MTVKWFWIYIYMKGITLFIQGDTYNGINRRKKK